jgi:C1A family cysteine protease
MAQLIKRLYGWLPDIPDHRDLMFSAPKIAMKALPPVINLRPQCPPVYDQGQLGSCTANAIAGAFQFEEMKQNLNVFIPARLFIYYNERVIENTINYDSGGFIRDGMKSINGVGVCSESTLPYDISKFTDKPSDACFTEASQHKSVSYQRIVNDLNQLKGCLADGYPFIFGFSVYESFESEEVAKSGQLSMPSQGERQVGGHAVMAVGYNENQNQFIIRNSWGDQWGIQGYFTMPYEYLTNDNLADDFWTLRLVV